jgi:D-alanyl-D-alanine carboxypeptidase
MACRALACAAVLSLLSAGCGGGAPDRPPSRSGPRLTAQLGRALDTQLREKVADAGIPGASAAIVFPDGRMWNGAAGHAVLEPERPMTTRTSLPFDSVAKVMTAALALRLVEQRRLRLDDTIRRWYPAWRGDPRATVRDLLGHRAGARDPGARFVEGLIRRPRRTVTAAEHISASPKPGARTEEAEYSNTGFVIAGVILQRVTRQPLAAALRREIFGHPGGEGLALQPAERTSAPRAQSYWYPDGGAKPTAAGEGDILPSRAFASASGAAGALAGQVPSLARFGHELFGGRILARSSLREMARFHPGGFWEGYGLGLAANSLDEHPMWGHGGDGLGSHTEFWHLPRERLTIAVAWNDELLDDSDILPALLRTTLDRRAW